MFRLYIALPFVLCLSACGSSEEGAMEPEQPPISIPNYEPLFGSDATSLSPLSGSVVTARQNAAQVRGVTGRLRHGGGKLVVDDGLFKFADNDGFDANGEAENEGVVLRLVNPGGRYDHASLYSMQYSVDGQAYSAVDAIGVATRIEDMPMTGTARYTGDAVYAYTNQAGTGFGGLGTYDARVDFAGGTVDSVVTVSTAQNPFTRADVANPEFDRIDMRGLEIDGTAYFGTNMQLVSDNSVVQLTGANTTAQVEGHFYGAARDSTGRIIPDEIAGEALLQGDEGNVILSFIGD